MNGAYDSAFFQCHAFERLDQVECHGAIESGRDLIAEEHAGLAENLRGVTEPSPFTSTDPGPEQSDPISFSQINMATVTVKKSH